MWIYEPFHHRTTKTTVEHLHNLTGIPKMTIYHQEYKGRYNKKLRCFFSKDIPRIKKKQMLNERIKTENEYWKYSDKYGLYVSNLGRFKTVNGKFKFANDNKGSLRIIVNKRRYRAADIVYETFIKTLSPEAHAYPKDSAYYNISVSNLFETTFKNYRVYRRNEGTSKALYLVDSSNNIVEEFVSTTEASAHLNFDRRYIAKLCNKKAVKNDLMFVWVSEYKKVCKEQQTRKGVI